MSFCYLFSGLWKPDLSSTTVQRRHNYHDLGFVYLQGRKLQSWFQCQFTGENISYCTLSSSSTDRVFRKLLYDWEEWGWPSKTWHRVFCWATSYNWVGTGCVSSCPPFSRLTIKTFSFWVLVLLELSLKIQLTYELIIIDVFWAFCALLQNNIYIYRVTVIKYWKDYQLYKLQLDCLLQQNN